MEDSANMTSMMNIKSMTCIKCMTFTVYIVTYIRCKQYTGVCLFINCIIIIPKYTLKDV